MAASPDAEPGEAQPAMPAGDGSGCRSPPKVTSGCCDWPSVEEQVAWVRASPGDAKGYGLGCHRAREGGGRQDRRGLQGHWCSSCKADSVAIKVWHAVECKEHGVSVKKRLLVRNVCVKGRGRSCFGNPSQIRGKGVKERLRFADQVKRGLFKHLSRTGIAPQRLGAGVHSKGRNGRVQWG